MENEYSTELSKLPKKPVLNQESTQPQSQETQDQYKAREQYREYVKNENISFMEKLKSLNNSDIFKEMLIIGILYLILTSTFYLSLLTKYCSFITLTDNRLNTAGLLITALVFGVLFIISRTFTSSS